MTEPKRDRAYLQAQIIAIRARLEEYPAPSPDEAVKLETALLDVLRQLDGLK